jgi:hypothetical protein
LASRRADWLCFQAAAFVLRRSANPASSARRIPGKSSAANAVLTESEFAHFLFLIFFFSFSFSHFQTATGIGFA